MIITKSNKRIFTFANIFNLELIFLIFLRYLTLFGSKHISKVFGTMINDLFKNFRLTL